MLDAGNPMNGPTMTLTGTEGMINIEGEDIVITYSKSGMVRDDYSSFAENKYTKAWSDIVTDLIQWIEGAPEPELGLTNMLKASELNLGIYLSCLRGDKVDLPLIDDGKEWPVEALARIAKSRT